MKKLGLIILALVLSLAGIWFLWLNDSGDEGAGSEELVWEPSAVDVSEVHPEPEPTDFILLKIAHEMPETHPQHTALTQKFVPMVESGSDWKIRVEVYPYQELGNEAAYLEGVRKGTVEMCIGSQAITGLLPNMGMTQLPYLFEDYGHFAAVMNSETGMELTEGIEDLGLVNIGWTTNGFRQISMTSIKVDGSNQDLRIGTDGSEADKFVLEAMGFQPRAVDMNQLTVAMQQSLIDGQDFPLMTAHYKGWAEDLKYIQMTNHSLDLEMYLMNRDFWLSLDEPLKEVIAQAADEAAAYEAQLIVETEERLLQGYRDEGVTIVDYDPETIMEDISAYNLTWIGETDKLEALYKRVLAYKEK